jgi:ubiquinone/menaquinone biosynthesis C-methylase UbiE
MTLWDLKSGFYSAFRRAPLFRRILDSEIRSLKALIAESGIRPHRVVDAGVGAGDSWILFPQDIFGIGIDASLKMLMKTRARFPGLKLIVADVRALPFRDKTIPFLSMIGVAEYIQDKTQLLLECTRVVASDGYLLVTLPASGLLTDLRNLLGARLFSIPQAEWEACLQQIEWHILGFKKTSLQRQYLLQRIKMRHFKGQEGQKGHKLLRH